MTNDKIGVFTSEKEEGSTIPKWTYMPATSEYLYNLKFIPSLGDRIALKADDVKLLGRESTDNKNVPTVKNRIVNYSNFEIAIILTHEFF
jgi:hypothetical protein